jgi:acetate kinase
VGENSPEIRERAVRGLGFLGLAIDEGLNADVDVDADVTSSPAGASTFVVRAREDREIARQVRAVVST